jgi:acyl-CoA reductase-like NAD-dependent aldehyde dehydrogenase
MYFGLRPLSRMLVHEDIYEKFMERVLQRVKMIKIGHPLDPESMMGAQVHYPYHTVIQL